MVIVFRKQPHLMEHKHTIGIFYQKYKYLYAIKYFKLNT